MATQTTITLVDDLDGTEADSTVHFTVEGTSYEVDLSEANRDKLLEALTPYRTAGRVVGVEKKSRRSRNARLDYDPAKVRAWAQGQGIELGARGRIPASVIESYRVGH